MDILLGLIWVQTVCKGYQQMLIVAASRQRYKVYCYLIVEAPSFAKGTTVW